MATSLLLLLDDIASVLDDVGVMTKVATAKTAGVIGDDLALNAHQVTGVEPARELAVVWRVALGSLRNKAILVPTALALSWLAPWAVGPLLMLGGAYLCYEGVEKLLHSILSGSKHRHGRDASDHAPHVDPAAATSPRGLEREKIAGAVRTDFILSAEIIVITLGVVAGQSLGIQLGVLVAVALMMTVGVYGLVAAIVRLDDLGLALALRGSTGVRAIGRGILAAAPWLLRGLSIVGTAAMFLVGGGIIAHGIPAIHEITAITSSFAGHGAEAGAAGHDGHAPWWGVLASLGAEAAVGVAAGVLAVIVIAPLQWLRSRRGAPRSQA
jgi:predicted DNA repair protein MutK